MLLASLHTSSGSAWRRAPGAESRCRPCRPLAGLPEMPLSPLTQADPLEQLPRQSVCSVLFAPPRLGHPNRQAVLRGQFPASLSLEDQTRWSNTTIPLRKRMRFLFQPRLGSFLSFLMREKLGPSPGIFTPSAQNIFPSFSGFHVLKP